LKDRAARFAWIVPPAMLGAAVLARLLDPARALAVRDLAEFHLPLRASLLRLVAEGATGWNPWIGGGQPIASDPSYSLFYPPTWLGLIAGGAYSFQLSAALHLLLAAVGAGLLARRLGARPAAAVFAAVAWSSSGALLSLVQAFNHLPGACWMSWILLGAEATVTAKRGARRRLAVIGLATAFALALLNGEPVTVLCSGLAAGLLALGRAASVRSSARALGRIAAAAALAALLASVQLVPALARLTQSARAEGLDRARALSWSLPPARALELVAPRAWGDPVRSADGLYFGWGIHDRDFPFLISVYASLIVLALALAALLRWPIPRRAAWGAMIGLGALLALGRHTPVYPFLFDHVPPFGLVRFPEKFFLLSAFGLSLAAALGLDHLLREREHGRSRTADLAIGLGAVLAAVTSALAVLAIVAPDRVLEFAAGHSGIPLSDVRSTLLGAFFAQEAWSSLVVAATTVFALVALRIARIPSSVVVAVVLAVLSADLARINLPVLHTADAATLARPPRLLAELPPGTRTIWSSSNFDASPDLVLLRQRESGAYLRRSNDRLDPWTGVTWGLGYALSTDYALTYTAPARRAVDAARELWDRREREPFFRLLGAWGAEATVVRKSPLELAAEARAGIAEPFLARIGPSPFALPTVRFLGAAKTFPDAGSAVAAMLAEGAPLAEREFVVGAPWPGTRRFAAARLTAPAPDVRDTMEIEFEAAGESLLVVATTWDRFWSARTDRGPTPVLETAAGYLAVPLPAGASSVELVYRDPWVRVGAAASIATLALLALVALRSRRPRIVSAST